MKLRTRNQLKILVVLSAGLLISCQERQPTNKPDTVTIDGFSLATEVNVFLDSMHLDAGRADFDAYFNRFDRQSVFVGTDAKEYWEIDSFMIWSKPFFDRGKAWNLTCLDRKINWNESGDMVWFYETLSTQMKLCRGSGVLIKRDGNWKIKQYVLSASIPNEVMDEVIKLKEPFETIVAD